MYLNSESPYTPLLGVCPDLLLKLLKLNIIEVGTKSPVITAPVIYTKGISNFVMNNVPTINTIKISDVSGDLSGSGSAISIKAWDVNGKSLLESNIAAPLKLNNHVTTILEGTAITARFPGGTPATYEFSIGSSRALVTVLTTSQDGTVKIPTVFTIGDCAGI